MAEWPELDELKQLLDVTSEDWDGDDDETRLTRVLASAIDRVKEDVGNWDEDDDEPDHRLAQAALRMAELISTRPAAPVLILAKDPTYVGLLKGHRRRFAVA